MGSWNRYTETVLSKVTTKLKRKRVELFVEKLGLGPDDVILDLGSENGSYLGSYYPYPHNIVLADIREEPMQRGVEKYGLKGYQLLDEQGGMPFKNGEFAAVWCNSAIEHVTLNKDECCRVTNKQFTEAADAHQREFAAEIARVGQRYFVQTPNVHFPIESHSMMPLVGYLTQPQRCWLSKHLKQLWIKQWSADYLLYTKRRFHEHFPDATEIHIERALGLPKSLIAIKK